MIVRLEDHDGKLITYATAPDDLKLLPVSWNGDVYRPFGTMRDAKDTVLGNYRRWQPDVEQRERFGLPALPIADAIPIADPNTPRSKP